MSRNALALRIADEISMSVRSGSLAAGAHLSTQKLADAFGVSRSPVREALEALRERGVVERHPNRGYFIGNAEAAVALEKDEEREAPDAYEAMAEDWLSDSIPDEVTEQFLRERYGLTRSHLSGVLLRAVREGWAERKPGYGWRFLPVAKTPEAFEQIYRFRMLIEPAAMLEPTFRLDRSIVARQRTIQQRMLDRDLALTSDERERHERTLPREEVINGSLFHEEIIGMSGNLYFHQALVRVNRMRRLMEYRSRGRRRRLHVHCAEHLEILDVLERGDMMDASFLMRRHLARALSTKSS